MSSSQPPSSDPAEGAPVESELPAPSAKQRNEQRRLSPIGRIDDRLVMALKHPLRLKILVSLNEEGEASPAELARRLGDTTERCTYHVNALVRYGFAEFASTQAVPTGVIKIYRATRGVEFPPEVWEALPEADKAHVITTLFQLSFADAESALTHAVFDKYPESHASWTHLPLDPAGWKRLQDLMDRTLAKAQAIAAKGETSRSSDDELLEVSMSLFAYPVPPDARLQKDEARRPGFLKHGE